MIGPFTEDNIEMMIRIVMAMMIITILCIPIKYFCRYRAPVSDITTDEINLQDLGVNGQQLI